MDCIINGILVRVGQQAVSPALPDVGSWWVDKTSGKIVLVTSVDVAYMTVQVRLRHLIGDVHISMFSGHYRPALTHEIPGEHREQIQLRRGLWRQRDGTEAVVDRHAPSGSHLPWLGRLSSGEHTCWANSGAWCSEATSLDLVAYIGPLPEDEQDPAAGFAALLDEAVAKIAARQHQDERSRAEWLAAAEAKCARAAEDRSRVQAERDRRAAMPVQQGGLRVPTEVPAAMVMLKGMGER